MVLAPSAYSCQQIEGCEQLHEGEKLIDCVKLTATKFATEDPECDVEEIFSWVIAAANEEGTGVRDAPDQIVPQPWHCVPRAKAFIKKNHPFCFRVTQTCLLFTTAGTGRQPNLEIQLA